jgi:hypothetical protein
MVSLTHDVELAQVASGSTWHTFVLKVTSTIFPGVSTQVGLGGNELTDCDMASGPWQASRVARQQCSQASPVARRPFALLLHLGVAVDDLGWERNVEMPVTLSLG